ncbi:3-dehydroshikimate dehydratase [Mangrovibacter sp. MFB070]|uniref:NosD domain-containing protein n=1 Tax=Mangrovibacter sp. MFB070 TaxID=1224318 RepID=UPI0004D4EAED|nr:NosD domain-containing protein [Mangrovibacter sp. MFB070]KEA51339.1 3-dehydroshikimate dehydratase [Mangrovibacter sp. MFB070]
MIKRIYMAMLLMPAVASAAGNKDNGQEILNVVSSADNSLPGTLRWALEKNNQNPGHYRIELHTQNKQPLVIRLAKPLPEIKGPVAIVGTDWRVNGQYAVIDGAGYIGPKPEDCPGAVKGQFGANVRTTSLPGLVLRDTQGVQLEGIEVRNFCIGVLINRASDNVIENDRIVANHGGAGVMLTGDDGKGNSTSTTTRNNKIIRNQFINNGDAMEATRGAAFNLIADNFITTDNHNPEPSQGLEMLWGNDNEVVHNHFENYSDGVQINWGNRNYIAGNTFTGLSSAVTLSGTGNVVSGNIMRGNRVAVSVRPQAAPGAGLNRITRPAVNLITENSMVDNGKDIKRCFAGGSCLPEYAGAIVFNVPGLEHAAFIGNRGGGISNSSNGEKICAIDGNVPGCEATPNYGQPAPVLVQARLKNGELVVDGSLKGQASARYRVEFFANQQPGASEAETFIGAQTVVTGISGKGLVHWQTTQSLPWHIATVTATATTWDGATSELSAPQAVH